MMRFPLPLFLSISISLLTACPPPCGTYSVMWDSDCSASPTEEPDSPTAPKSTTCEADADGDGFTDPACGGDDCDDANPYSYPGAPEGCDGIDTDCNGLWSQNETDNDGDGQDECNGDCDDLFAGTYTGAEEVCDDNRDNDCDGTKDDGCPAP